MTIKEVEGNLFTVDNNYTLVHCISACGEMGKGIAVEFVQRNPGMRQYIKNVGPSVGEIVLYKTEGQHPVYNLITKRWYDLKPKRAVFNQTLLALRDELKNKGIKKVAMPRIGSGLDKLSWKVTLKYMNAIFAEEDIEILVFYLPKVRKAFNE